MNTLWLSDIIDDRAIEDVLGTCAAEIVDAPKSARPEIVRRFAAEIRRAILKELRGRLRTKMIRELNDALNRIKKAADMAIEKEREEVL